MLRECRGWEPFRLRRAGDLVLEMEHHFTAIAADVTSNLVRVEAGDLFLEATISCVYYSFSYSP